MEEKIAVHCPTIEIWDMVRKKIGSDRGRNRWDKKKQNTCLEISPYRDEYSSKSYFMSLEYTIISAQEYLNEGGKDAMEFKVGDRVEIIIGHGDAKVGMTGEIFDLNPEGNDDGYFGIEFDRRVNYTTNVIPGKIGHGYYVDPKSLKVIKTQTTKENDMKDNNIDSNVLAVFGSKVNGDELVVIDRHFTDRMLTRILMEKHHKAIQDACKDAEAEVVKAEKSKK